MDPRPFVRGGLIPSYRRADVVFADGVEVFLPRSDHARPIYSTSYVFDRQPASDSDLARAAVVLGVDLGREPSVGVEAQVLDGQIVSWRYLP